MNDKTSLIQMGQIEQVILLIRGRRVMLDRDLAALYCVTTGNLNKAVHRNLERFPADFMFQLTAEEAEALSFHFGSLKRIDLNQDLTREANEACPAGDRAIPVLINRADGGGRKLRLARRNREPEALRIWTDVAEDVAYLSRWRFPGAA